MGDLGDELLVCPVRTLRMYIKRTKRIPARPGYLFLSPSKPSRQISKNAISFFLRDLIVRSGALGMDEGPTPRAHSIRSVATTAAFARNCPVARILETACWRSVSTFASFYLRDQAVQAGDFSALSACVVAGQLSNTLE